MAKIVFFLTDGQAAALLSIRAGQGMPGLACRFQSCSSTVLIKRGLVRQATEPTDPAHILTPLGIAAAAVADQLAKMAE